MVKTSPQSSDMLEVFNIYQGQLRDRLLELRELIFEVAAKTDGVGEIEETLKWGQPSYLTNETKSGTTIRIDKDSKFGCDYALYVNCKTSLIDNWREIYPKLKYGGNRSVHFSLSEKLPKEEVSHMIAMALTYHKP